MDFPVYHIEPIPIPPSFEECMGFIPVEFFRAREWSIAVADNETTIKQLKPHFDGMVAGGFGETLVTSQSDRDTYDYVLRCFAPAAGIPEDPVTGSAQCALVPFWQNKLDK